MKKVLLLTFIMLTIVSTSCTKQSIKNESEEEVNIEYENVYYNDILQEIDENSARAVAKYEGTYISFVGRISSISTNGYSFSIANGKVSCNVKEELKNSLLNYNEDDYITVSGKVEKITSYSITMAVDNIESTKMFYYNNSTTFGMTYQQVRESESNKETSVANGKLYFNGNGNLDKYGLKPTTIIYDLSINGVRKITVSYFDVDINAYESLKKQFEEDLNTSGEVKDDLSIDLKRTIFKLSYVCINLGYFTDTESISLTFMDPTEYTFLE